MPERQRFCQLEQRTKDYRDLAEGLQLGKTAQLFKQVNTEGICCSIQRTKGDLSPEN
jgi:hypothetical protein